VAKTIYLIKTKLLEQQLLEDRGMIFIDRAFYDRMEAEKYIDTKVEFYSGYCWENNPKFFSYNVGKNTTDFNNKEEVENYVRNLYHIERVQLY
jgi:hypothetical protein